MSGRRRVSGRTRSGRTVPSRSIPRELTLWFCDNVLDVSRIQRTGPTTFRNPLTGRQNIIPSAEKLPSFLRRQQRTLTARKAKEDAVRLVSFMRPLNWAPHDALDDHGVDRYCVDAMWANHYKAYQLRFDISSQIDFCLNASVVDPFFALLKEAMVYVQQLAESVSCGSLEGSEALKFYMSMDTITECERDGRGERSYTTKGSKKSSIITRTDQMHERLLECWTEIQRKMAEADQHEYPKDVAIDSITLNVAKYNPITGSEYFAMRWTKNKGVLNIKNKDNKCFLWCTLAVLHPASAHPDRVSNYKPYENELVTGDLEYPISPDDVQKLERLIPDIVWSLYVREWAKREQEYIIRPYKVASLEDAKNKRHVQLLLCTKAGGGRKRLEHWVVIKDFNKLCSKSGEERTVCPYCLCSYYGHHDGSRWLQQHEKTCRGLGVEPALCVLPPAGSKLPIRNAQPAMAMHPAIIVADIEAILPKRMEPQGSKSIVTSVHEPVSIRMHILSTVDLPPELQDWSYVGTDQANAHIAFVEHLLDIEDTLMENSFPDLEMLPLTSEQQEAHDAATHCCFCGKGFDAPVRHPGNQAFIDFLKTDEKYAYVLEKVRNLTPMGEGGSLEEHELHLKQDLYLKDFTQFADAATMNDIKHHVGEIQLVPDIKVHDHDHGTGAYRGAAHSCCNLQVSQKSQKAQIPIVFHNAEGYDSHYIFQAAVALKKQKKLGKRRLRCIPTNAQKFKTFSFGRFVVKDSMAFLGASLDTLLRNLPATEKYRLYDLAKTWNVCDSHTEPPSELLSDMAIQERFRLLQQKLPFPYEWFDCVEKLKEPIQTLLANPTLFASQLRGESRANENDMVACDEIVAYLQEYQEVRSQRPFYLPGKIKKMLKGVGVKPPSAYEQVQGTIDDTYVAKRNLDEMKTLRDIVKCFNIKTFRDLHDLYLAVDVFGLADVMESFRKIAFADMGLDPMQFVGLPSYGWEAMLTKTQPDVELLSDIDMFQLHEGGVRGGVSFAGHRFHEANHTGLLPELPPIVANHSMPDLPPEIPREVFQPLIDILQTSQGNDELMMKLNAIKDEWLDCSDLPADHPLFSTKNKKIPGKFKNETGEEFIRWMVALRAKMYAYETRTKQAKICKGTSKGVVEREITLEDYRATQATALLPKKQRVEKHVVVPAIRSKDHTLKSMVLGRRALSGFDDKRWICEDGTSTRALGHYRNKEEATIDAMPDAEDSIDAVQDDMEVDVELKDAGDIMSDDEAENEAEDEAEDEATDDNAWCEKFMELCKSLDVDTSMDIIHLMLTWCKKNGYDPMKPTSWLLYIDANNLYGYAMLQPQPTGDFQWLHDSAKFQASIEDEQAFYRQFLETYDGGATLEADLEYPSELHDMHSTFPLAPEKMTIVPEQIPEALRDQCTSSTKLVTHLGPRKNYVVALRNLRFYLKHGMVLTKVHRVLTYKESPWLKEWVEFCTKKRAAAKNDFEKDFWKLMANAVYGKTMEDVRKRMKVYFVDDTKRFKRKVAKPSFQRVISLGDDFGVCVHDQDSVLLNKPISTGFAVLEESKLLMYRFHYEVMIPLFGWENLTVTMSDTDSYMYRIMSSNKNFLFGDKKK